MNAPISVIIPTHHRPLLLSRAIKSVLEQGDLAEIIVCADESSSETREMAESLLRPTDKFKCFPSLKGPSSTRNEGAKIANGEWVYFLDDDDTIENGFFSNILPSLNKCKSVAYTNFSVVYDAEDSTERPSAPEQKRYNIANRKKQDLLIKNFIHIGAVFTRREHLETVKFDSKLPSHEDWDFVLNLKRRYHFEHINSFGPLYHQRKAHSRNDVDPIEHYKIYQKIYRRHKTFNPFIWFGRRRFLKRISPS